ncbi:MAG: hypothetical protein ACOZQL_25785 [Myxococcota bacterium]
MRVFALILMLSSPAFADIPPPLWASRGCIDFGACTSCSAREADCGARAVEQGLELACSARQRHVYCRPGLTSALVGVSGWAPHLVGAALVAGAVVLVRRRRRAG